MLLALAARPLHGLKERSAIRTFALTVGIYNYGYIPLPLSMLLFDKETTGVLMVHNVGVETALWTIGVSLLTGLGGVKDWRKIVNAPLIAIALALLLNLLGLDSAIPTAVRTGVHWLGQCAIPTALILIGAVRRRFHGRVSLRCWLAQHHRRRHAPDWPASVSLSAARQVFALFARTQTRDHP